MGQSLYLECESGISGDMFVGAMLDLGADQKVLEGVINSLPIKGYDLKITRVKKSGLDACDFNVILEHDNHDHDMEYLHGHDHHEHSHGEEHEHTHEHGHGHEEEHNHGHHHHAEDDHHEQEHGHSHAEDDHHEQEHGHSHDHAHHHEHRGPVEVMAIINASTATDHAKKIACDIFEILADAEAKAHGVPKEEVHFHEVGAIDSIVDVLAAAVCLDNLGITEVIVPGLTEGTGTVRCQHGVLPIPVPAVSNIIVANQIRIHITQVEGELVTPTGAAIAAAIRTSEELPENFKINRIGLGAGKRDYPTAGVVRAMLIEE